MATAMRKKRTIAKSRAASLKGWRTRQRMEEARGIPTAYDIWLVQQACEEFIGLAKAVHKTQPTYMRHALPNPWLELK
jgi:hypothetical protein